LLSSSAMASSLRPAAINRLASCKLESGRMVRVRAGQGPAC
jgi:hypothetical protein